MHQNTTPSDPFHTFVGKRITGIFCTKLDGPHEIVPGLGPAYYFSTVLEIEELGKYELADEFLAPWIQATPLFAFEPHSSNLTGCVITTIKLDADDHLSVQLDTGLTIHHTTDYGDSFLVEQAPKIPPK